MSKKITVRWPSNFGIFPDMIAHVDDIQSDWADSIAEEFQAIENELGLNPSRTYETVRQYNDEHNHYGGGTGGPIDHENLDSIGVKTHSEIDTHITSTNNPHVTTLEQARLAGYNFYGNVYFNGHQAVGLALHQGDSFPADPVVGQMFYRTDTNRDYIFNGSVWEWTAVALRSTTRVVASDGSGDFTTIQTAINDLPGAGGEVVIREGTYNISSTITVPSDVTLRGMGMASKIFLANGSNCDMIQNADHVGGNEKVRIEKLYLDGNKANNTGSYAGIYFKNTDYYLIQGVKIENTCEHGIKLDLSDKGKIVLSEFTGCSNGAGVGVSGSCSLVSILDSQFYTCEWGIYLSAACSMLKIKGNTIYESGQDGIRTVSMTESIIENNIIMNNGKDGAIYHGIRLDAASEYNLFSGNRIGDTATPKTQQLGIDTSTADYNVFVGNNLRGNDSYGFPGAQATCEWGHNLDN